MYIFFFVKGVCEVFPPPPPPKKKEEELTFTDLLAARILKPERANNDFLLFLRITRTQP